ncbi:PI-actitoxin-Afv2b-like [Amblyomma americanum]
MKANVGEKKGRLPGSGVGVFTGPLYIGPCKARFLRFYYDASSNTCRQFTYGGCRSKGNYFETQCYCMIVCGGRRPGCPQPR